VPAGLWRMAGTRLTADEGTHARQPGLNVSGGHRLPAFRPMALRPGLQSYPVRTLVRRPTGEMAGYLVRRQKNAGKLVGSNEFPLSNRLSGEIL